MCAMATQRHVVHAVVGLCLMITCTHYAQAEVDIASLKSTIASTLECRNNPGLSVAVVKDGKVLLAEGFGVSDVTTNHSVTNQTVFGIASLSKAFASALLVKLLSKQKQYSLETKVKDILGEDFGFAEDFRTDHTTLEDILSHRTGLAPSNVLRFDNNLTRENLHRRIKYLPLTGKWRSSYIYNNLMYGLVTRIAEVIGGATWEELVQRELYDPLQMTSSAFLTTVDFTSSNVAKPYDINSDGEQTAVNVEFSKRWAMLCGSGCVMMSAEDAANWMRFHLSLGLGPTGERVMDEKDMEELYAPRTAMPWRSLKYFNKPDVPFTTSFHVYGLGWRRGQYRGYQTIVHSGSTFGYRAYLTLYPTEQLGVFTAMSGNDDGYSFRIAVHNYIADTILGETPWLNVSTLCSFPSPWFNVSEPQRTRYNTSNFLSRDPAEYEGVFHSNAFGNLVISYNETEGQLFAKYGFGTWRLYQQDGDEFYGEGYGISNFKRSGRMTFMKRDNSTIFVEINATGFGTIFVRDGIDTVTSASNCLPYPILLMLAYLTVAYYTPCTCVQY